MINPRRLNLRHLEGLVAIASSGSFNAAAARINLTQSALTQAVASIETAIGRRLFDRASRGAVPTAAGVALVAAADRALAILNDAGEIVEGALGAGVTLTRRATSTQLGALAAVEHARSFRGAARASGLSEASIHRSVRSLERSIGAVLIARTGAETQATPAASAIARATRLAMAELQSGLDAAAGDTYGRTLVIGAMPLVRAGLLPSAMAQLCALDANVRLHVREGAYSELLNALLDGQVDMLLGALRAGEMPGIVQRRLFDDELVIVARSDHPLARSSRWQADALAAFPWAASPEGTPRRLRWEETLRAGGVSPPAPRIECSSASAVRGLLLQGGWLAMLSPDQFRIERELGLLIPLGGPLPISTRPIGITTRAGWKPDAVHRLLLEILDRCASEHAIGAAWSGQAEPA